jgi:hypothetical protein
LAACFDGQRDQPRPAGVRTVADLLGELESREQTGQTDTADLDQWLGVLALRSLALRWWRDLLTPARLRQLRFEFCIMVSRSIDQGNHAQLIDVATTLFARRNLPPPYIPAPQDLDSEECLRAQQMARQTVPSAEPPAAEHAPPSAEDESAYRPAREFIDAQFPDHKAITKALGDNPSIRRRRPHSKKTGQPIPNRLSIHAGDWKAFLAKLKQAAPDPLDLPAHVVGEAVQEVQERKAEERRRKEEKRRCESED